MVVEDEVYYLFVAAVLHAFAVAVMVMAYLDSRLEQKVKRANEPLVFKNNFLFLCDRLGFRDKTKYRFDKYVRKGVKR